MRKRKDKSRAGRRITVTVPVLLLVLALVMPCAAETVNAAGQTQTESQADETEESGTGEAVDETEETGSGETSDTGEETGSGETSDTGEETGSGETSGTGEETGSEKEADTAKTGSTGSSAKKKAVKKVKAPKKVQIRSAKITARGYITLKWKKRKNASGYVVYRSVNGGSYKKVKTVKNATTVKWTDKKTKSGKTYRYRIRAYKKSAKKKVYGKYSKVKKVKIRQLQYQRVTDIEKLDAAEDTNKLIIVNASGVDSYIAVLQYFKKTNGKWKEVMRVDARVGKNGINKKKEGDYRTPTGAFYFTKLFGIKSNPGTIMPYTKLTYSMYWCASSKKYYNLFVNDAVNSEHKYTCSHSKDEQLAAFGSVYNYCAAIGYNTGQSWKKGSAIFLHCTRSSGSPTPTAGCVAVDEDSMRELMRQIGKKTMIVIDRYDRIRKY